MKNNYVLVHGSFGSPYVNWFPWLNEELEKKGCNEVVPSFPIGVGFQNYENWSKLLKVYLELGYINETTTLVAIVFHPYLYVNF